VSLLRFVCLASDTEYPSQLDSAMSGEEFQV